MARVDLSDSLNGPVWVCQTTTFSEPANEREWGTFLTHEGFSTRAEAREWASHLANDYMDVLLRLIGAEGSTGISVDVQPRVYNGIGYEPHPITDSWEVIPGRPVDEWHLAGDPFRTHEGRAYAVLEGDGTLTLFRSAEKYAEGTTCRTHDLAGVERTGVVWDCPEAPAGDRDLLPGWHSRAAEIRRVSRAYDQAIKPVSCVAWFAYCESLETLDLSGLDTSQVTDMRGMFADCKSIRSLDLSGWDTSRVENMGRMFAGCESLEQLDLSGWDLSSARHLESMFRECRSLESLDLSGWDTSKVTDMSLMFARCESLEKVDVASWDVSNVTNMTWMFADCDSLEQLDLSGWDLSRLDPEGADCMFFGCASLELSMAEHDER